jgi:hypothetical protein
MSTDGVTPRTWRQIAEEVIAEYDPHKLAALVEELNRALDEHDRAKRQCQIVTPPAKRASA